VFDRPDFNRLLVWVLLGLAATHTLFASFPAIDLAVSSLFFDGTGFPTTNSHGLEFFRLVYWDMTVVFALSLLFLWCLSLVMGHRAHVSHKIWLFGWGMFIIGPGLLVNAFMKTYIGRARPADSQPFGGEKLFTPPFEFAGQCERNCSFVSGEGTAAVVFAIVTSVLFWRWVPQRYRGIFATILIATSIVVAGLRVINGRHYLSDILIGGWLMALLALVLFRVLKLHNELSTFTPRACRADLRAAHARFTRPVLVWLRLVTPRES